MSDVISGLASGMTVKFFPIYFMQVSQLDPVKVQCIYIITPIIISLAATMTQWLSTKIGRVWVTLCVKVAGISLLLTLTYLTYIKASPMLVVPVYILRTSFMNSTKPLTKSIIMDAVPKDQRGRWNCLESVNAATWSGSALIGGYLIDQYGFLGQFLTTSFMQFVALLPLLCIAHLVPPEKPKLDAKSALAVAASGEGVKSGELKEGEGDARVLVSKT